MAPVLAELYRLDWERWEGNLFVFLITFQESWMGSKDATRISRRGLENTLGL